MEERPKCQMPECGEPALMLVNGRLICGKCVIAIDKAQKEAFWKSMEATR